MKTGTFFTILFFFACLNFSFSQQITDPEVLNYNYAIGTINIIPMYGFTCDNHLIEGAKIFSDMGSNSIKLEIGPGWAGSNLYGITCKSDSDMVAVVRDDSSFRAVMDMPFKYYFFWARTDHKLWADGYSAAERTNDSLLFDALTKYLLTTYNNSGKKFFLGDHEGDWSLLENFDENYIPSDARIQGMIQWYTCRQNAIDAAKNAVAHQNVDVFHYTELNSITPAQEGKRRVVNYVLPYINPDYVSYSSYNTQNEAQPLFDSALNYIESKLLPKPSIPGKRVLIGEFGQNRSYFTGNVDSLYEATNRDIIRKSLKWGTPYVWLWSLYDGGFGIIETTNKKTLLFETFTYFFQAAKKYVYNYKLANNKLPTQAEYFQWAYDILADRANLQIPPDNDDCTNAYTIGITTSCKPTIGNVAYATQSIPAVSCGASIAGTANDDVWYKFVATTATMAIKVVPDTGFDPVVDLYDGCGGSLIGCSSTSGNSKATELIKANNLIIGHTYYVRVYDWKASIPPVTTFSIFVYEIPVNDDCAGAILLNESSSCVPVKGTAVSASESFPANACGPSIAGSANDDVWFKFKANATDATIKVVPDQGFDAVVDVFDGCGGALIGCSSTAGNSGATETVNVNNLTIGQTYYIRVYDWKAGILPKNTFNICVYSPNSTNVGVQASVNSNPVCFGQCNGTATATPVGGTGPYTYVWSNTKTTQTVTGLCAGSYSVTVTDVASTSASAVVTVTQPSVITLSLSVTSPACGNNNGSVFSNVSGGASPYSYSWNNGSTSAVITGLTGSPTQTLIATVADANGCAKKDTVVVQCFTGMGTYDLQNQVSVFPLPTTGIFKIQGFGSKIQGIEIYNIEGEKVFQSTGSDLKSEVDLSSEPAGFYFLKIKTENGTINKKLIIQR